MGERTARRATAIHGVPARETAIAQAAAAHLQQRLPGWLVVWGPWHRCFTAFGACTTTATVIDAPTPGALLHSVQEAQLAAQTMQERARGEPLLR